VRQLQVQRLTASKLTAHAADSCKLLVLSQVVFICTRSGKTDIVNNEWQQQHMSKHQQVRRLQVQCLTTTRANADAAHSCKLCMLSHMALLCT
jgi:hypothetical protein